jgi:co-chaperonin GroES (HSP10)
MPLQSIGNKILVLPSEPKQEGSILLVESYDKPKTQGVVVNVGNRVKHIKAGDVIVFERMEAYNPGRVDVDGVPHFLMAEEQVLAILQ